MAEKKPLIKVGKREHIPSKEEFLKRVMKAAEERFRFDLEKASDWDRQVLRSEARKFFEAFVYGDGKLFGDGKPFAAHWNVEKCIDDLVGEREKITIEDTVGILANAKAAGPKKEVKMESSEDDDEAEEPKQKEAPKVRARAKKEEVEESGEETVHP